MKDFNFFEPYLDKKEITSYNNLILYLVAGLVVLGLIIYPIINIFRINSLNKSIAVMKTDLESSSIYEKLNIVEEKKEKLAEMEEKLSLLENIDRVIEDRDIINDLLINQITNKVPRDVFFTSLNLSASQIQIQGAATNNLAIAHLESNLRSDEDFEEVYIPNISLNEGLYNFSINFALKDEEEIEIEEENLEENDAVQKDVD